MTTKLDCALSPHIDDYQIIKELGRGQFGTVHEVIQYNSTTNEPMRKLAWKIVSYSQMETSEVKQLQSEVKLCESLDHPNVVRYLGRLMDRQNQRLCLVMEHCGGGDLGQYITKTVKHGNKLPENQVLVWCSQLLEALHHCHSRKEGTVLHRDIKPQNVLLSSDSSQLKLADFGLAKLMRPQEKLAVTYVGTPYYMSPEVLTRQCYDERSDIWSLGCVMYEMASGRSPYGEALHYEHLKHLVQTRDPKPLPLGPPFGNGGYSMELNNMIMSMLCREKESRPDTDTLRRSLVMKYARALSYKIVSEKLFRDLRVAESQVKYLLKEKQYRDENDSPGLVEVVPSVHRKRKHVYNQRPASVHLDQEVGKKVFYASLSPSKDSSPYRRIDDVRTPKGPRGRRDIIRDPEPKKRDCTPLPPTKSRQRRSDWSPFRTADSHDGQALEYTNRFDLDYNEVLSCRGWPSKI